MPEATEQILEEETVSSRKRGALPLEKGTEERLKIPDSNKKFFRVKERNPSPDEEEDSDSGSSDEEAEMFQEEEVFAFDDTALPQVDDILGLSYKLSTTVSYVFFSITSILC